jgi:hypothetical protein
MFHNSTIPQQKLHTVQISSVCWLVLVMDADPAVKMAQKTSNFKQHKYCVVLLWLSSCFLMFFWGTKKFPLKIR